MDSVVFTLFMITRSGDAVGGAGVSSLIIGKYKGEAACIEAASKINDAGGATPAVARSYHCVRQGARLFPAPLNFSKQP